MARKMQKALKDSCTKAKKRWNERIKVEESRHDIDSTLVTVAVRGWRQPSSHILHYAAVGWEPIMLPSKVQKKGWKVVDNRYTVIYDIEIFHE